MRWYWKCVIDSGKALFPFQNELRAIKYKLKPYAGDPANETLTIGQGLLQVEWMRAVRPVEGMRILEVGTGWQPLIPIVFSLAGAREVLLTDRNRLCTASSFGSTLRGITANRQMICERLRIGGAQFDQALAGWKPEMGLETGLRHFRLRYLAPCDCQKLDLPDASLDAVTSRAVLEHIPPPVIENIFAEGFRLLAPGGIANHIVDNSDHWEFRDKSITRVNFLQYSDSLFRWTTLNGLNYQNRLRHPQYLDMLRRTGHRIEREERAVDQPSLAALPSMKLDPQFAKFNPEDLATITTFVQARKA